MPVAQPRYLRSLILAVGFVLICFYTLSRSNPPISEEPHIWLVAPSDTSIEQELFHSAQDSDQSQDSDSSPEQLEARPLTQASWPPQGLTPGVIVDDGLTPCMGYQKLQALKQEPLSEGKRKFPYSRPAPKCRTFNSTALENLLVRMKKVIKDPDLYRLFENAYPNTLDTTIKWRGYAQKTNATANTTTSTDEELAFVITGDINAMWLRDSASQIYSYLSLLEPSSDPNSLASLWRGVINMHARYITISPYCHSFQPPPESGIIGEVGPNININQKTNADGAIIDEWRLSSKQPPASLRSYLSV